MMNAECEMMNEKTAAFNSSFTIHRSSFGCAKYKMKSPAIEAGVLGRTLPGFVQGVQGRPLSCARLARTRPDVLLQKLFVIVLAHGRLCERAFHVKGQFRRTTVDGYDQRRGLVLRALDF